MEKNTSAESASAEPIRLTDLNPLLNDNPADTLNYVAAVLATLADLRTIESTDTDGYDFGLSLIHRWLENTIRFISHHPDVESVIPVVGATRQPGEPS